MTYRSLERTEAPAGELISLDQALGHVRVDADDELEVARVEALLRAAAGYVERRRSEVLQPSTWRVTLDRFPAELRLPSGPVIEVQEVTYRDLDGVVQTLAPENWIAVGSRPAVIVPAAGTTWPSVQDVAGAVQVTYRAGYPVIPEHLRQAVLILMATWWEHREAVVVGTTAAEVPMSADALIDVDRVEWLS